MLPIQKHAYTKETAKELQTLEKLCKEAEALGVGEIAFYELLKKMNSLNVVNQLSSLSTDDWISALRDRFYALKEKAIVHLDRCIAQLTSIDLSLKPPPIAPLPTESPLPSRLLSLEKDLSRNSP